jgi:hypothetical protein
MPRHVTPASSLETLKREAKDWLKALRDHDADARARFEQALPDAPPPPTLRDVQLAIASELGFAGWGAVRARQEAGRPPAVGGDAKRDARCGCRLSAPDPGRF